MNSKSDKPERQTYDIEAFNKREAERKRRDIVTRELIRLPYKLTQNVIEIIGIFGDRSSYFRTCITCGHFESLEGMGSEPPKERCTLYNVLPPAKVIADGCKSYQDSDDIPF